MAEFQLCFDQGNGLFRFLRRHVRIPTRPGAHAGGI